MRALLILMAILLLPLVSAVALGPPDVASSMVVGTKYSYDFLIRGDSEPSRVTLSVVDFGKFISFDGKVGEMSKTVDLGAYEDRVVRVEFKPVAKGQSFVKYGISFSRSGDQMKQVAGSSVVIDVADRPVSCGDGKCNAGETCSSCRDDCGACPSSGGGSSGGGGGGGGGGGSTLQYVRSNSTRNTTVTPVVPTPVQPVQESPGQIQEAPRGVAAQDLAGSDTGFGNMVVDTSVPKESGPELSFIQGVVSEKPGKMAATALMVMLVALLIATGVMMRMARR